MFFLNLTNLSPRIKYARVVFARPKPRLGLLQEPRYSLQAFMNYLYHATRVNPTDPFKHRIVKYLGLYLR